MKKSTKVLFAIYKVIYAVSMVAAIGTYVADFLDPAATFCRVTSTDWFTLAIMSCAMVIVCEADKKAKTAVIVDNASV